MSEPKKEDLLRAELLHQQLEELEHELGRTARKRDEIAQVRAALHDLTTLSRGDELLVPLAPGLFTHATFAGKDGLLVNIGEGIVVPKTVDAVRAMLDEQDRAITQHETQLRATYDEVFAKLSSLSPEA